MRDSDVEGVEDGAAGGHVAQGLIQVHGATGVVGVDAGGGVLHTVGGVGAHGGHQQRGSDLAVAVVAEDPEHVGVALPPAQCLPVLLVAARAQVAGDAGPVPGAVHGHEAPLGGEVGAAGGPVLRGDVLGLPGLGHGLVVGTADVVVDLGGPRVDGDEAVQVHLGDLVAEETAHLPVPARRFKTHVRQVPLHALVILHDGGDHVGWDLGRALARHGAGSFGTHEVAGPLGLPVQEGTTDAAFAYGRVHGAGHGGVDLPGWAQAHQAEGAHDAVSVAPGDTGVGGIEEVLGRQMSLYV